LEAGKKMDIVTKRKLNILIQLAEADRDFAKSEREMILRIARDRKFEEETVNALIKNPEPIESLGALSQAQKFDYLTSCIELIFVDGKVLNSELTFARNIAIKLGFKKTIIDYLVQNYTKIPAEELKRTMLADYALP
jgi:uncharacterized tellurite resistance protein B-like protein